MQAAVSIALRDSGYHELAGLQCESKNGMVVLSGVLPTYYLKQLAQTIVLQLDPPRGVDNRVAVLAR